MPEPVIKYGRMMKNDIRTLIGGYFLAQFKIMFVVAVVLVDRNVIPQGSIWNFSWNRDRDSGFSADVRHRNGIDSLGSGETLYRGVRLCASLVILYVLTQGIRQVIQPKIVGDSMGLPPLATLFFLYLGFKFRGIAE